MMLMSPKVDQGRILAHYLPAVDPHDTPDTLFDKTSAGAVELYSRILDSGVLGEEFQSIRQGRALFNYKGADWTIFHSRQIRRYLDSGMVDKHERPETVIDYWRQPCKETAHELYRQTIYSLLGADGN